MKISVKVKPNSKISKVIIENDIYTVYIKSSPIKGMANTEVVNTLSKYFNVAKSNVIILRGKTSHTKLVEIL